MLARAKLLPLTAVTWPGDGSKHNVYSKDKAALETPVMACRPGLRYLLAYSLARPCVQSKFDGRSKIKMSSKIAPGTSSTVAEPAKYVECQNSDRHT
jgi:hypothetical protein